MRSCVRTCPGRSMEKDPTRGGNAQPSEDMRVEERQHHHLLERLHMRLQPPYLVPSDAAVDRHRLEVSSRRRTAGSDDLLAMAVAAAAPSSGC